MKQLIYSMILLVSASLTSFSYAESSVQAVIAPDNESLLRSYRRVLPLEGGSNFRDLGGYPTADGRRVKRGLLFRSGAMTSLTEADIRYLNRFDFETVVDLRSTEELELYPNHWVAKAGVGYRHHDYSMVQAMSAAAKNGELSSGHYAGMYRFMTDMLKPDLIMYFEALVNGEVPVVVNCSAGQDRTGVASALLLTVLGVDRDLIIEDYLLSTDFRRPTVEAGDVDLKEAAKTNGFAAMMLEFSRGRDTQRPNPLLTPDGVPFIVYTFETLEARYGSIEAYLEAELGVTKAQQAKLRDLYLS